MSSSLHPLPRRRPPPRSPRRPPLLPVPPPPPFSLKQRCLSRATASPWTRRRDGSPRWIPSSAPILHLFGRPVATQQQATCSSSFLRVPSMVELDGDAVQPDHGHDYLTHKSLQRMLAS